MIVPGDLVQAPNAMSIWNIDASGLLEVSDRCWVLVLARFPFRDWASSIKFGAVTRPHEDVLVIQGPFGTGMAMPEWWL